MARRSDHTRSEIKEMAIAAGQELMTEGGLAGFSARKVAKAIGYTVGTIYNVFENHDHLILQVNAVTLEDMETFIRGRLETEQAGEDAIMALAGGYLDFARENYPRWSALFEHHLPPETELPGWYAEKIHRLFQLAESVLSPAIQGEKAQAQNSARVLWAGIHGICQLGLTQTLDTVGAAPMERLIADLVEHYMAGVRKL